MSGPVTEPRVRSRARTAVVHVLGSTANETNPELVRRWRSAGVAAALLEPAFLDSGRADEEVRRGDLVVGRIDVLPTLDGLEPGLSQLRRLQHRRIRVLNPAAAVLAVQDKLRTARLLHVAGVPHPRSAVVRPEGTASPLEPPLVLKPRFGSWGRDVVLCRDDAALARALDAARERSWFRRHGALVQELVEPRGYDLRVVVAGGRVVGAAERIAAPREWRTNVSLGGELRPVPALPEDARALAVLAARAVGADFVGVDLLPLPTEGWIVLELNGAVDFDERYSLPDGDVYADAAAALSLPRRRVRRS